MSDRLDQYRTVRLPVFEIWENGKGELPLLVMFASRGTWKFVQKGVPAIGNVINHKRTGNPLHPTQKPIEILERILTVMQGATTVYPPFGGSGSTLIAAERLGVPSRLIELDPGFCDVICTRFQNHTGVKPVHDGVPYDFTTDAAQEVKQP